MKTSGKLRVLLPLLLLPALAQAQGFYVGGSLGYVRLDDDITAMNSSWDDTSAAMKIAGGYQVNDMLGMELQLASLGAYESRGNAYRFNDDFGSFTVVANGRIPLGNGVALFGQAGVGIVSVSQHYWVATVSGTTPVLITDDNYHSGTTTQLGGGIEVRNLDSMGRGLGFRFGYEQFDFDVDRDYLQNGALYSRSVSHTIDHTYFEMLYYF